METILVVGINGAIGKAVAKLFAEKGIKCLGTSSRRNTIPAKSKELFYLDLEEDSSIAALIKELPGINGIVFCAGFEPQRSLTETDAVHHRKMIDIHVTGPLFVVQLLKEKIKKTGSVIFISSIAAQKGSYDPSYAIAKSAVGGMTRTLAKELAVDKIRVNAIAPGLVKGTPVHKRMTPDFTGKHLQNSLLQQLTTTQDCAEAIYFLYTQKQMTGQLVHINGGQHFGN
jgi:3-oxoacyl-[acyl-carrier protein] reductase